MMFINPDVVSFQDDYDYFGLRFTFLMTMQNNEIEYELSSYVETYCFDDHDHEYIHDGCELPIEIFKDEFIGQMLKDFLRDKLNEFEGLTGKLNLDQRTVLFWEVV